MICFYKGVAVSERPLIICLKVVTIMFIVKMLFSLSLLVALFIEYKLTQKVYAMHIFNFFKDCFKELVRALKEKRKPALKCFEGLVLFIAMCGQLIMGVMIWITK